MAKLIKFDDGTVAYVLKADEIRQRLTKRQAEMLVGTTNMVGIPHTKEVLWIQHPMSTAKLLKN